MLDLLFSKFGAILAGGLTLLLLFLRNRMLKRRAERAEAQAAGHQAQTEIVQEHQKINQGAEDEKEKVDSEVDADDAQAISDRFNTADD